MMDAPVSQAEANTLDRIMLCQIGDARHYGGRRTRLIQDKQELAERIELENHPLVLARKAIHRR